MAQQSPTAIAVQEALGRMRGVVASRVVAHDGDIAEVHILADAVRPAKQIVRDVESLCAAQFGIKIDHRKVSVAQIETPASEGIKVERPEIRGVRIETEGVHTSVHVALGVGDEIFEGEAAGTGGVATPYRLAASASLRALETYLRGSCRLILDDLIPFHLGEWEGFLAGVILLSTFGEERLVGSALVKKDKVDAAIKAACNAVNRRIKVAGGESDR